VNTSKDQILQETNPVRILDPKAWVNCALYRTLKVHLRAKIWSKTKQNQMVRIDRFAGSLTYTLLLQSRRAGLLTKELGAGFVSKPNFFELSRRF
jgi:hypothetical protein